MTMHTFPRRPDEVTKCCGRRAVELPLADGQTSDAERVTCDGTPPEVSLAHEVYPHPAEGSQAPALLDAVRYHLARALALQPEFDGSASPEYFAAVNQLVVERHVACLVIALAKDLSGQAALDWAHWRAGDETGEVIYDLAKEYDVELHRIRRYETTRRSDDGGQR